MPASLLDRATAATDARAGRTLFAFGSTQVGAQSIRLAKGERVSRDVGVLKAGTFHGGEVVLDRADLEAIVSRFDELYPDVFVPPFRVDHGWSVTEVVGYFEALRVVELDDPSNGGRSTPYLVGDVRWIDDAVVADLARPVEERRYRNRSSELGSYTTNAGVTYPLAFWGCAFVDIPAVEGLDAAPISLRTDGRAVVAPVHSLSEGSPVTAPAQTDAEPGTDADAAALAAEEAAEIEAEAATDQGDDTGGEGDQDGGAAADDSDGDASDEAAADADDEGDEGDDAEGEGEPTGDGGPPDEAVNLAALRGTSADLSPAEVLRAAGFGEHADRLDAELSAERTRAVDLSLEQLGRRGLRTPATEAHLRTLLSHREPATRQAVEALLAAIPSPTQLGNTPGTLVPSTPTTALAGKPDSTGLVNLEGMTGEELGSAWSALTTAQRQDPRNIAERDRALAALHQQRG